MLPVSLSQMSSNGDGVTAWDDAWESIDDNTISGDFHSLYVSFSLLQDDNPTFEEITSYYHYNLTVSLQDEAACGAPLSDLSNECNLAGLSERYYEYSDFVYYKGQ